MLEPCHLHGRVSVDVVTTHHGCMPGAHVLTKTMMAIKAIDQDAPAEAPRCKQQAAGGHRLFGEGGGPRSRLLPCRCSPATSKDASGETHITHDSSVPCGASCSSFESCT
jgi:hypothetical protein